MEVLVSNDRLDQRIAKKLTPRKYSASGKSIQDSALWENFDPWNLTSS
jgi:hypothetical protein